MWKERPGSARRAMYDDGMSAASSPPPFVHLHLHTHFSLLDATIRVPELTKQVAALGMPAVAVTDHGNLFAAFQFHRARHSRGNPSGDRLRGLRGAGGPHGTVSDPWSTKPYDHLVLLAENKRGYWNLVWLVSRGYLEGFYHKPRISKEILAEHAEG